MYQIIAADGKQYGPYSIEQLREWLKEGRLSRDTSVWTEGMADWAQLGSLSEMAGVPPPLPAGPPAAGTTIAPMASGVPGTVSCPNCNSLLAASAVLCTQCGFNLRAGTVVGTQVLTAPSPLPRRAPARISAPSGRPASGSGGGKSALGIVATIVVVIILVIAKTHLIGGGTRTLADSSIPLMPGQYYSQELKGTRTTKLRGSFTCSSGAAYSVYLLDASDAISLRARRDPSSIPNKYATSGTGTLAIPATEVRAGTWSVVIFNPGNATINVQYKIEEVR